MSSTSSLLPNGFQVLEPFVEYWAVAPAALRAERRTMSTEQQRVEFYKATNDILPLALEYLDKKPLALLDEQEQRLMNLMCSYAHAAYAVEVQANNEPQHASLRKGLRITRATADARS
jgi:hypothetical protein